MSRTLAEFRSVPMSMRDAAPMARHLAEMDVKQRAVHLMRDAGRRYLVPAGATPKGRSGRYWIADRGWWLVNIEFQPSSYAVGAYLNVGLQHLWDVKDYMVFEYSSRQAIGGFGQYVELDHDDESTIAAVDALCRSAEAALRQWLDEFEDDDAHYEWLTGHTKDPWNAFNAAFAYARLGKWADASRVFRDVASRLDAGIEWQASLASQCCELSELTAHPEEFTAESDRRTQLAREALKL